jgi:hypothetical protein
MGGALFLSHPLHGAMLDGMRMGKCVACYAFFVVSLCATTRAGQSCSSTNGLALLASHLIGIGLVDYDRENTRWLSSTSGGVILLVVAYYEEQCCSYSNY